MPFTIMIIESRSRHVVKDVPMDPGMRFERVSRSSFSAALGPHAVPRFDAVGYTRCGYRYKDHVPLYCIDGFTLEEAKSSTIISTREDMRKWADNHNLHCIEQLASDRRAVIIDVTHHDVHDVMHDEERARRCEVLRETRALLLVEKETP